MALKWLWDVCCPFPCIRLRRRSFEELEVLSDDIRALPSLRELETLYEKIGLPVRFGGIGVSAGLLSETIEKAWTVRDRYTIMTFLHEKGALGEFAARLSEAFRIKQRRRLG